MAEAPFLLLEAEHQVKLTNPEKLLWAHPVRTKVDYAKYLISVAPYLLAYLSNKSVTVIRFVHGIEKSSFYQKHLLVGTPGWMTESSERRRNRESFESEQPLEIFIDDISGLLWWANQGALEFHVGFTTFDRPEFPDMLAFDLDPTVPGFERVRTVALEIHDVLTQLRLPHIAKTSGATGLQILVPLDGTVHFEVSRAFTKTVAEYVAKQIPKHVTLERLTKHRQDKVYIDYPQHGVSRTLIAPYSARATKYGTVSSPVTWEEIKEGIQPTDLTMDNLPDRLGKLGDLLALTPKANYTQFSLTP